MAPFAPFIADELWQQLGHSSSVHKDSWPKWDEKYLQADTVKIAVQVNGKLRAEIEASTDATETEITKLAKANDNVKAHITGKKIIKTIYVPGKLVNLVAQ